MTDHLLVSFGSVVALWCQMISTIYVWMKGIYGDLSRMIDRQGGGFKTRGLVATTRSRCSGGKLLTSLSSCGGCRDSEMSDVKATQRVQRSFTPRQQGKKCPSPPPSRALFISSANLELKNGFPFTLLRRCTLMDFCLLCLAVSGLH